MNHLRPLSHNAIALSVRWAEPCVVDGKWCASSFWLCIGLMRRDVLQVYGARLTSRLVHGICLAVAILMGCIALICLTEPFWNDSGNRKSDVEEPLLAGQPQAASEASATAAAEPAASAGAAEPAASAGTPAADEAAVTSAAAPSAAPQHSGASRPAGGGKEAAKSAQSGPVGSHPV